MTDAVFWPDVSHYQVPVDDRFAGPFLMYKISEGATYVDPNAAHNGAWCHANAGPGKKLVGHGGYHVWSPGNEQAQADLFFANAKLSPYFVAMIDVESWGGRITGDHSASITRLATLFGAKLGSRRVKVYANAGDLAQLFPKRPAGLGLVKASYSSQAPPEPWVGWQYTDGSSTWPIPNGWPRSSKPFGTCDHNAYLGTLEQFAAEWGLPSPTAPPAKPPVPSTVPLGTLPFTPSPAGKEAARMDTRILIIDKKTVPAGKKWVGDFLQFGLSLHHIVDLASFNAYKAAGYPIQTITYAEYAGYVAEGWLGNPVKA